MNINDLITSKYLKAADLNGSEPTVTISHVTMERMGEDTRPVLYMQGKEKGVVLNKTNLEMLGSMYGDETDGWTGRKAKLVAVWTQDKMGKPVQGLRFVPPEKQLREVSPQQISDTVHAPPRPVAQKPVGGPPPGHPAAFDGDEIPF